jgi:hypothetical protein
LFLTSSQANDTTSENMFDTFSCLDPSSPIQFQPTTSVRDSPSGHTKIDHGDEQLQELFSISEWNHLVILKALVASRPDDILPIPTLIALPGMKSLSTQAVGDELHNVNAAPVAVVSPFSKSSGRTQSLSFSDGPGTHNADGTGFAAATGSGSSFDRAMSSSAEDLDFLSLGGSSSGAVMGTTAKNGIAARSGAASSEVSKRDNGAVSQQNSAPKLAQGKSTESIRPFPVQATATEDKQETPARPVSQSDVQSRNSVGDYLNSLPDVSYMTSLRL